MDRSARTLLAVAFFTIAAFLGAELLIRRAPIGEWPLTGVLALLGGLFAWLGARPDRAPEAAVAAGEQQLALNPPLPSGVKIYNVVPAPAAAAQAEREFTGDDLTILPGVDTETAEALRAADITTFAQLAELAPVELTQILGGAGEIVAGGNVEALLEQARLAATAQASATDDLAVLDGIGPKISATLKAAGVNTFVALSGKTSDELRAILTAAGVPVVGSSIETWPRQAQFAAAGDWPAMMRYIAESKKVEGGAAE